MKVYFFLLFIFSFTWCLAEDEIILCSSEYALVLHSRPYVAGGNSSQSGDKNSHTEDFFGKLDIATNVNDTCMVSAEYAVEACVGQIVSFTASPSFGQGQGNTQAVNGHWIIDGEVITIDKVGLTLGVVGKQFIVAGGNDVNFENFFEQIEIEFQDPGNYDLQYFYDFTSCSDTADVGAILVNELPKEILNDVTERVCYGEDATIGLNLSESSIYIGIYEVSTTQLTDTFSNEFSSIIIEDIQDTVDVRFINLVDTISNCVLSSFDNEYTIIPFDPISTANLKDSCVTEEGQYFSQHQILGGSGSYEFLNSNAGGQLIEDTYVSGGLAIGQLDTLFILDTFCVVPSFEFPLTNSCACSDTTAIYDNSSIYESCESSGIQLILQNPSKSSNPATESILRTYEKNGSTINFLTEQVITNESQASIPYNDLYTNGKNYFARSYITTVDDSGQVNYQDFCIDSSSQEIIFRFFQNPDAEILGEMEVCENQSEVIYQPSKIQSNTNYEWETPINTEVVEVGNQIYVKFLNSGNSLFTLNQTYFPQNSASNISCVGVALENVAVTLDKAPERSDIVFFEPNFLSIVAEDDYCIQWFSVEKQSGVRSDFGMDKQWLVEGYNPDLFFYGAETKFPIEGNCDFDGYCQTTQYYNKSPITGLLGEDDLRPKVEVYPNPASGRLNLKYDPSDILGIEIELYSILGVQQVVSKKIESGLATLDVSQCQNGIYFLLVSDLSQQKKIIKKVIIE